MKPVTRWPLSNQTVISMVAGAVSVCLITSCSPNKASSPLPVAPQQQKDAHSARQPLGIPAKDDDLRHAYIL